jgi:hypothetical protein
MINDYFVLNMGCITCFNGFRLLLLLLCLNYSQAVVKCGLEFMEGPPRDSKTKFAHLEGGSDRSDEWEHIRIHIEYYNEDDVSSSVRSYLKDIIEKSVDWYKNVLNVKRLTSPIVLDSSFELREFSDNTPINYTPPDKFFNEGIEADYIFFVGLISDENLGWVGIATAHDYDSETNQPVIGQFEMNYFEHFTYEDDLSTSIHEMAHALGFAHWMYENFIKEDGEKYDLDEVVKSDTVNGVEVFKIITPTVLKKAREAFGCDSLDGVPLESQGGASTAGSHWEKRVMYNDFMMPDEGTDDFIYSDITMALFEDSGWYTVNYEYTQTITWGYKMGCDLLEEPCIEDGFAINQLFCEEEGQEMCDYIRLNKGSCNLASYYGVPEEYQYFSDESLAGTDSNLDYCPIIKSFSAGNCRGIGLEETEVNSDLGEEVCENCRCVEGTYSKQYDPYYHTGCHWIECGDSGTIVHIGDEEVECPIDGGEVEVPNYNGVLYCPRWEEVCLPVPCLNACSGIGVCNRGVCECPNGSMGGDCADIDKDFSYRDPIVDIPDNVDIADNVDIEDSGIRISGIVLLLLIIVC